VDDDYEFGEEPSDPERFRSHDPKVDEAKAAIMERYLGEGKRVFYSRQIEVGLEREFFHWITSRALEELVQERAIQFSEEQLEHHRANFYYPLRHRYPRRQIGETIRLIAEFSDPVFTRAVGHHGEMLVSSSIARIGFRILDQKVRRVDGVPWTRTNHDLDFLIEGDGVRYGVEVKNQLGYIDQTEFGIKLGMCEFWGIRPMFVTRMLPRTYIHQVFEAGGFAMITANQNYPLLANDLARRVRETLSLPVGVIERFPDTALTRFKKWHDRSLQSK
jgi:hypothetical protein